MPCPSEDFVRKCRIMTFVIAPLALVARSMAVEWPAAGLGVREMALRRRSGCGAEKGAALRFERPSGRSFSLGRRRRPPAPGRVALLEGPVLGLLGAIDEKAADQPGARAGGR